ncbi:hypothetical protein GJ744_012096 [Endocarpon pusillum]|uniref:Uncharacterized protein n=1 Tax=Endocarpon pusillum TaxID=364733 RepID=A0A8H7ACE9_9EURO|nr:hypothetical protein GJ744_012096 [Endocarpon pusillum]
MVFLTTTATENLGGLTPMGSFVYAMPNRFDSRDVLNTTLYSSDDSIDHAIRMAKILARRMNTPVYLGCSMQFSGLVVEEQMQDLRELTKVIMDQWSLLVRA